MPEQRAYQVRVVRIALLGKGRRLASRGGRRRNSCAWYARITRGSRSRGAPLRRRAELHWGLPAGTLFLLPDSIDPVPEAMARDRVRLRVTKVIDEYHLKRGPSGISDVDVYVLPGLSSAHIGHLIALVAKDVGAEAVVVGSHGRRGLQRVLLGSVAEHVVREAPASVFVIRPPDLSSQQVPAIEPPLAPGEPHLKSFAHRHTYHYADKSEDYTSRTMPVT